MLKAARFPQIGDQAIVVPMITLEPEPYELVQTVPVVVQRVDDQFVASFFDANINASGETQQDAVANLKDVMLALYLRLRNVKNLAKGPARQRAILQSLIQEKAPNGAHHQRTRKKNRPQATGRGR